jgi:hypothetical protein
MATMPAPTTAAPRPPAKEEAPRDRPAKGASRSYAEAPAAEPAFGTQTLALVAFEAAERAVELSLGSCDAACRALGSMERAAKTVCDLARAPDEKDRCTDARARLSRARSRVRSACGSCAGGPTTEPDAPLP